ncbi:MAG: LptF/LptG family permease [Candidatus Gastranaerophilales bacterium]|nr:LptF/LptG family permease [Candidatus Gastranaerophilales bacterium]
MSKDKMFLNLRKRYYSVKQRIKKEFNKLSILDRYILNQLLSVFTLGIIIFTSIIFASETFTQLIKQISLYGIPFHIAIMMIILNLPQVIVLTIPISMLFATVMTINDLSLKSEITIFKACGISIERIARPIFCFAVVMMFVSFFINEFIVPATSIQSKSLAIYSLEQKHIPENKMNFTVKDISKNGVLKRLFYAQWCKDKTLNNVTVIDISKPNNIQIIQAKKGTTSDYGWKFKEGVVYTISKDTQKGDKLFNTSLFEESDVTFGIGDVNEMVKESTSEFNFFKLLKHIKNQKQNLEKKVYLEYQINLYDKLALPITTLALALIGLPLGITPPRVRYNRGFLFSIVIIFIYYVIRALSLNLGESGKIAPFLAAWLPVIIISATGLWLFYKKAYKI